MKIKFFICLFLFPILIAAQNTSSEKELTEEEATKIMEAILGKAEQLGHYLQQITNRDIPRSQRKEIKENAIKMFVDDERIVQTSSLNSKVFKTESIRDYLNRIYALPYDKIEIAWYDITWKDKLRYGPDGKLAGKVRIFQGFVGYVDGVKRYSDLTTKDIEVLVKKIKYSSGNQLKDAFDIKLGDIAVTETRRLK